MNTICRVLMLAAVVLLAGCVSNKRSSIGFNKDNSGSLSVWNADMSAALEYANGQMCMQRALAIKTIDATASVKVSEALLALAEAAKSAAAAGNSSDLASVTATLKETATLLTTTTERTAFLDLGMFYVCQMAANGSLTDHQTAEAVRMLTIAAASLASPPPSAAIDWVKREMPSGENSMVPRPYSMVPRP